MNPDLTKLILDTTFGSFKQNSPIVTGSSTISGSTVAGVNTRTFTVILARTPDLLDVVFNGPTDLVFSQDPRPSSGWFKKGSVWVPTNNAGGGNPSPWQLYTSVVGSVLTITAVYVQQFTAAETLTSTTFSYRIIDYSVF